MIQRMHGHALRPPIRPRLLLSTKRWNRLKYSIWVGDVHVILWTQTLSWAQTLFLRCRSVFIASMEMFHSSFRIPRSLLTDLDNSVHRMPSLGVYGNVQLNIIEFDINLLNQFQFRECSANNNNNIRHWNIYSETTKRNAFDSFNLEQHSVSQWWFRRFHSIKQLSLQAHFITSENVEHFQNNHVKIRQNQCE